MKLRRSLLVCASLMFLAAGCSNSRLGQSNLAGQGGEGEEQNGVGICHTDGKGRYHEIFVSENAITWLPEDGKWTGHPVAEVGDDGKLVGVSFGETSGSGGHHTGQRTGHVDLSSKTHPCECFTAADGGPQIDPDREGCCGKEGAYCELEDANASRSDADASLVKCCDEGLTCQRTGGDANRGGKCLPETNQCANQGEYCDDNIPCCPGWECGFENGEAGTCGGES